MSEKKSVTVTIYKNEYTLKGEADAQHIIDLAKYVDTRMTEMGQKSSAPADKIAILVSMNIADELHRLEKKNEENLKLIDHLEKSLEEFKVSSDNAIKNAASLNEQADNIRMQLSQEKEKNQAAMELKVAAENRAVELTKELEKIKAGLNSNQGASAELQASLSEQREKTQAAEEKYEDLKKKFEDLEVAFLSLQEEIKIAKETPTPASTPGSTISDDRFHFLIKKIETVLE